MARRISVLVVEDDGLIRDNIVTVLEDDGFSVQDFDESAKALAALNTGVHVDCMITDVDLGKGIDGLDLASAVHQMWPAIGIIVVSGKPRTMPIDVPDAKFFIKPYDPERIASMVRELFDEEAARDR